jgi:hypothetical protein
LVTCLTIFLTFLTKLVMIPPPPSYEATVGGDKPEELPSTKPTTKIVAIIATIKMTAEIPIRN